ncbi:MAG: VCBS repeat-containing protein [Candidatus Eisenbacteria bacterium]|nr:VCBS repeat-containing protein [Candidatus Eisenbacteria bacterium]
MRSHVTVHGAAATSGLAIALFLPITDLALAGIWFDDPVSYAVPKTPSRLAVGHFNADAHLDVVVGAATGDSESAYIYLNDGVGGLNLSATLPVGNAWFGLAVGDFNGDGRDDIAVSESPTKVYYASASYQYPGPAVSIPLDGFGTGQFGRMVASDLDADGYCDLVGRLWTYYPHSPDIRVIWGGPTGLTPGNTEIVIDLFGSESCPSSVIDLVAADADGDADTDIVVSATHEESGSGCPGDMRGIGVVWCDGPRIYRETEEWIHQETVESPAQPYLVPRVARLGADALVEIVYKRGSTYDALYGTAIGTWAGPRDLEMFGGTYVLAEVDGDGIIDFVNDVAAQTEFRRGLPDGSFELVETITDAFLPVEFRDLGGDEKPEMVGYTQATMQIHVYRNHAPVTSGVRGPTIGARLRAVPSVISGGLVRFERASVQGSAGLAVEVRDVRGRTVWRGTADGGGAGVRWDLRDRRGALVPGGVYFAGETGSSGCDGARVLIIR